MITHYFRTLKDDGLKVLDQPRTGVWTHAVAPSEVELVELVREWGLDEAVVKDSQDFFEVPRLERSGSATYCFTRYPYRDPEEDAETAPLLIVMGESFVVTVAMREVPQFESFITGETEVHTTQKAKFFIQLMQAVIDSYDQELARMRRAVRQDRAKLRTIGKREIEALVNYEHELNDMIGALVSTNAWLQQVTTGNYMQLFQEDMELMEDLMIANSQLVDSARSVLKTIQNIRKASEAIMTSDLNTSIRTLTILTILLTVPTIIASLFGMNVTVPFATHPFTFWMVVVLIVIVMIGVGYWFYKNKWL